MKQKNLLASFIVLSCIGSSKAQINKGSVWLSGSLHFSTGKTDHQTYEITDNSLGFTPGIGLAVANNLVLGIDLNYYRAKHEEPTGNSSTYKYGAGFFARKYVPVINKVYFFGHGAISGNRIKTRFVSSGWGEDRGKGWEGNVYVAPGLSFAATKKILLETSFGSLGFTYTDVKTTTAAGQKRSYDDMRGQVNFTAFSSLGVRLLL